MRLILEALTAAERKARIEAFKAEYDLSDPRQPRFVNGVLSEVPGTGLFARNAAVGCVVVLVPVCLIGLVLAWLIF